MLFPNANEHFAHHHFIAKELANALKAKGVESVITDEPLQMRLQFYGIKKGGKKLTELQKRGAKAISVVYYQKEIARYYLW